MSFMEARRGLDLRSEEGVIDGMCCFVTGAGKIRVVDSHLTPWNKPIP